MKKKIISVIIPVRTITNYVRETVSYLQKQTFKNFEIIIVTDKKEKLQGTIVIASGEPTPAFKRNLGAKKSKGEILAFLDDDSYPDRDWLKNSLKIFSETKNIAAVCGPTLTPPTDNIYQKASGWVWATPIGSGGAGTYRNKISSRREVDDFPSVNLLVRKSDFNKIGCFDTNHWPGEDTKLCLDLTKTGKKIVYDPSVLVFHHRRPVFCPHLRQISRYALRRGYFAKVFPETSFRIGYLLLPIFAYSFIAAIIMLFVNPWLRLIAMIFISVYLFSLLTAYLEVLFKEKNLYLSVLVVISIFLTHITYGLLFPFGYFKKELKTHPHEVDLKTKAYIGG